MSPLKKMRCRHERNSWIVAGGLGEWCYVCGAYRGLTPVAPNESQPRTVWIRPTGDRDNNPAEKLTKTRISPAERNMLDMRDWFDATKI